MIVNRLQAPGAFLPETRLHGSHLRQYTVVDLWENQRGVSNVFLTYFDYFSGINTNLGVERHQRGGG